MDDQQWTRHTHAKYRVTSSDETVTLLSVYPNESLEGSIGEVLPASGTSAGEVSSIELPHMFDLETEVDLETEHAESFE